MGENDLYTSRTHPKALFRAGLAFVALLIVHVALFSFWPDSLGWDGADKWAPLIAHGILAILNLWYAIIPVMQWWNSRFTLTDRRVRMEWGVLYKHSREIDLKRIASISEERGILDRIFGCGTLNFYDAAAASQPKPGGAWNKAMSDGGVKFHDVPSVKKVRALIEDAKYNAQTY